MHGKHVTIRGARVFAIVLAVWLTIGLFGCSTIEKPGPRRTAAAMPPVEPATVEGPQIPATVSEGSLWQAQSNYNDLYLTQRARHLGDVITVQIIESAKASNAASTDTSRDSKLSAGVTGFFGAANEFSADSPFFNPFGKVSGNMSSEFEGDGTTTRSNKFIASISTRVVEVLPNRQLRIRGQREVRINNESEYIYLSGIVRIPDISDENIVVSKDVAEAVIEYTGEGVINDRQRPGWLTSLMNAFWPF